MSSKCCAFHPGFWDDEGKQPTAVLVTKKRITEAPPESVGLRAKSNVFFGDNKKVILNPGYQDLPTGV